MSIHFSAQTNEWSTPQAVFDAPHAEFDFTLDAAATDENAKCKAYFTLQHDGLSMPWNHDRVWLNPPYGRAIGKWVQKAYLEAQAGALVVLLIPARTETAYWHDYAMKGEIRFIRGRLKFSGAKYNAPFPSAIVIFRPKVTV